MSVSVCACAWMRVREHACERLWMWLCVCVSAEGRACCSLSMGREGFERNLRKSPGIYLEIMDYEKEKGGKELV